MEKAIRVFEEHNDFNAGRGSCLNTSGGVECDAMIMDGHNMKTGTCVENRTGPFTRYNFPVMFLFLF